MAIENFNLVLKAAKMLSPNARHLIFTREDGKPLAFIPGQFITFLFEGASDAKIKRRSYSLSTIPTQSSDIELVISYVKGGVASEKLFAIQPGDKLAAMGPAGRLVLPDMEPEIARYILVGTGTGIAPYRAMIPKIEFMASAGIQFIILEGVQHRQDLLYGDDFVALASRQPNVKFYAHFSREKLDHPASHEKQGYVQTTFSELNLSPATDAVYLCGNPNMIDEAFSLLTAMGFNAKNVRREKYISSN